MINRNSLAFKNAITYFILFIIGIGLLGLLLLGNSSDEIIQASEKQLIHSTDLIKLKFKEQISELNQDINYLATSPLLYEYLESNNSEIKEKLTKEYLAILSSKPSYAQIRFIGKENNGKEIIRTERNNNKISAVHSDSLQSKGNRDYYANSIILPPESFYLSNIDLNKEYGKISYPETPTIRSAQPVYFDDEAKGVIVINLDLTKLFNSLKKTVSSPSQVRLINENGFYLLHEDESKTFLFEHNKPSQFKEDFEDIDLSTFDESQKMERKRNLLLCRDIIDLPGAKYKINSLIVTDKSSILQNYYSWRNQSYGLILGLGLIFMVITFLIINRQSARLQVITDKLRTFPKTLKVSNLPTLRKDEIGQLAIGFQDMAEMVSKNMESLEKAKAVAENAVKEKEEFLENISHEIRNPLQSISGLTEIIIQNNSDKSQKELLNSLKFNTSNLNILINDLLDFKKVINGDIQLHTEWVDLGNFLQELQKSNNFHAISRKNTFKVEQLESIENTEIYVDKLRLSQILNNLITNAIKFTYNGKIELLAIKNVNGIQFSISDTGTGLDADEIDKINNRYYSGENANQISVGHGIGLTIVTELLEVMNAHLNVESEKDIGSIFSFDLPLATRDTERKSEKIEDHFSSYISDAHVLIIEDDNQIIEVYKHIFESKIKKLTFINSLEKKRNTYNNYDIIISDFKLSNSKSSSLIELLKGLSGNNKILFIISASNLSQKDFGENIIIDEIIQKPFSATELLDSINNKWIDKHFGVPDFSNIENDYDNENIKIRKALELLLSEWNFIKNELVHAIQSRDDKKIADIHHKIITTIRRLKLEQFEEYLEILFQQDSNFNANMVAERVNNAFSFYIDQVEKKLEEL